jgi:hypothetical protein
MLRQLERQLHRTNQIPDWDRLPCVYSFPHRAIQTSVDKLSRGNSCAAGAPPSMKRNWEQALSDSGIGTKKGSVRTESAPMRSYCPCWRSPTPLGGTAVGYGGQFDQLLQTHFGLVLPSFDRPGSSLHPVAPHHYLLSSSPSRPRPFRGASSHLSGSQMVENGTGGRG